jgi:hypothetical protein
MSEQFNKPRKTLSNQTSMQLYHPAHLAATATFNLLLSPVSPLPFGLVGVRLPPFVGFTMTTEATMAFASSYVAVEGVEEGEVVVI